MARLDQIPAHYTARLRGLLFDLDDTLLDEGKLLPEALDALYRLKQAGFELHAVTGRPAGWGAVLAHQWPVDGALTENGAVYLKKEARRVTLEDPLSAEERQQRRAELEAVVSELRRRFPSLVPADDTWQRISDFTFDIGEYQRVPKQEVFQVRKAARELGANTLASSVHLHITLDRADKASGSARCLSARYGIDPFQVLLSYAFIGDSENDAACFAAFRLTLGVKNQSGRPTLPPRFLCQAERAHGFVEAANLLLARRRNAG